MCRGICEFFNIILAFSIVGITLSGKVADDSLNKFSWKCVNNASCVDTIAQDIIGRLGKREPVDLGLFTIHPTNKNLVSGRADDLFSFFNGNIVHIPLGPLVLTIHRPENSNEYLELALYRSISEEGRGKKQRLGKGKKQLQILIPLFLAANALGWTMLAVKTVGVLTVKALLMSKLAFLVAAGIILKRLMEKASEKMFVPPQYLEPHHDQPYVMPYNMEYAVPSNAVATPDVHNDLYSIQLGNSNAVMHPPIGQVIAESSLNHAIVSPNVTGVQQLVSPVAAYKVKREDANWTGISKRPFIYKYVVPENAVHMYRQVQ